MEFNQPMRAERMKSVKEVKGVSSNDGESVEPANFQEASKFIGGDNIDGELAAVSPKGVSLQKGSSGVEFEGPRKGSPEPKRPQD